MSEGQVVVLDPSVGVKWSKPHEVGSDRALALLASHRDRTIRIVVPSHFLNEVLGTAVRHGGPAFGAAVWQNLQAADLTVVGLDDTLATAVFDQCRLLGCSFYDALAPALATLLGATLCSADARAHASFPGVMLVG